MDNREFIKIQVIRLAGRGKHELVIAAPECNALDAVEIWIG